MGPIIAKAGIETLDAKPAAIPVDKFVFGIQIDRIFGANWWTSWRTWSGQVLANVLPDGVY
jgi:hypothetical protein